MRQFTNRPRVTYNPTDTMSVFAEDMNQISDFINSRVRYTNHIQTTDTSAHWILQIPIETGKPKFFKLWLVMKVGSGLPVGKLYELFVSDGATTQIQLVHASGVMNVTFVPTVGNTVLEVRVTAPNSSATDFYMGADMMKLIV